MTFLIGLFLLVLVGLCALFITASHESQSITDESLPSPPTKDAYDV